MALTTGERKTITTASSVSNRMGVVPAYGGDALATFAKTATEKLDFFAQRQATLEENKWKADTQLKTYKAIKDFARENWDNPTSFVNKTDTYVETLINKAPKRFQAWTKTYAGMMAAQEGEVIANTREKLDFQEAVKANELSIIAFHDKTAETMYNMTGYWNKNNIDSFKEKIYDAELGEIYERYISTYNVAKPSERRTMDPPKEWLRKQKLGFELLRVNSKIKKTVDETMRLIREESYSVGHDRLKELNRSLTEMLEKEYRKNPKVDDEDGYATLIGSTLEERGGIIEEAKKFLSREMALHQKEINTYELTTNSENKQQHTTDMNNFLNQPENYINLSSDQLINKAVALGLEQGEIDNYVAQYHLGQKVNEFANRFLPKGEVGEFDSQKSITDIVNDLEQVLSVSSVSALERLEGVEGDTVKEKLRNMIINQNLKSILDIEDLRHLELGTLDIFARDKREFLDEERKVRNPDYGKIILSEDGGLAKENDKFAVLTAYAYNLGQPIPQITNFLNSMQSINVKSESGLDKLDRAAYMVNYFLTKESGYKFLFKDLDEGLLLPLQEYHEIRQLNTGGILNDKGEVVERMQREVIALDFFSKMNLDHTTKGQIKTRLDELIIIDADDKTGGIDLTAIINKQLSKGGKLDQTHRWKQKGVTGGYRSYVTGERISAWTGSTLEEKLEIDNNSVQQIIRPILDLYLTQGYHESTSITEHNLRKKIDKVLDIVLDNFMENGLYWSAY